MCLCIKDKNKWTDVSHCVTLVLSQFFGAYVISNMLHRIINEYFCEMDVHFLEGNFELILDFRQTYFNYLILIRRHYLFTCCVQKTATKNGDIALKHSCLVFSTHFFFCPTASVDDHVNHVNTDSRDNEYR